MNFWFLGFLISEGKPIPTELRNEEAALRKEIDLEDEITAGMLICQFFFSWIVCIVVI